MPFLIDGHNVIAALHDIDLDDPDDEAKLVMKLRAWSSRVKRKAIVIFDGGLPGGFSRTMSTADVGVVFAARYHTNADRIIDERLSSLPDAPNWTVVSSDHEVLDRARAKGARTITAQEFAAALNRPPAQDRPKPDAISAAEVDDWLQIFQEPELEPQPVAPPPHTVPQPTGTARPPKAARRGSRPAPPPPASTRSIADQLGIDVPPDPEAGEPSGKPRDISKRELESWLQVFHDDPNSTIAPPNLPPRATKPARAAAPVITKAGSLSASQVDSWLAVFGEADERAGNPQQDSATPPSTSTSRRVSTKLAKHQQNIASAEDGGAAELSDEDLELWHRLFGDA